MATGAASFPELEPTGVNTRGLSSFLCLQKDRRTVLYTGRGSHSDYGCVQADAPCPTRRLCYYFELEISAAGEEEGNNVMNIAQVYPIATIRPRYSPQLFLAL